MASLAGGCCSIGIWFATEEEGGIALPYPSVSSGGGSFYILHLWFLEGGNLLRRQTPQRLHPLRLTPALIFLLRGTSFKVLCRHLIIYLSLLLVAIAGCWTYWVCGLGVAWESTCAFLKHGFGPWQKYESWAQPCFSWNFPTLVIKLLSNLFYLWTCQN